MYVDTRAPFLCSSETGPRPPPAATSATNILLRRVNDSRQPAMTESNAQLFYHARSTRDIAAPAEGLNLFHAVEAQHSATSLAARSASSADTCATHTPATHQTNSIPTISGIRTASNVGIEVPTERALLALIEKTTRCEATLLEANSELRAETESMERLEASTRRDTPLKRVRLATIRRRVRAAKQRVEQHTEKLSQYNARLDELRPQIAAAQLSSSTEQAEDTGYSRVYSNHEQSFSLPTNVASRSSEHTAQNNSLSRQEEERRHEQSRRDSADAERRRKYTNRKYAQWEEKLDMCREQFTTLRALDSSLSADWARWQEEWKQWNSSSASSSSSLAYSSTTSSSTSTSRAAETNPSSPVHRKEKLIREHLVAINGLEKELSAHAEYVDSNIGMLSGTLSVLAALSGDATLEGRLLMNCAVFEKTLGRLEKEQKRLSLALRSRRAACTALLPLARHSTELMGLLADLSITESALEYVLYGDGSEGNDVEALLVEKERLNTAIFSAEQDVVRQQRALYAVKKDSIEREESERKKEENKKVERVEVPICVICLDPLSTLRTRALPCGHAFHAECLSKWTQIRKLCPICKRSAVWEGQAK